MITLDEAIEILSRPKTMKGTPQDILEAHDMAITALRQPEHLTDDDFETIRIHLSAFKESLCNQRRWKEAEDYERLIGRFMSFASSQSKIAQNISDGDLISRQAAIDATWFEPSYTDPLNVLTEVRDRLKALPSAERHGKWIIFNDDDPDLSSFKCSSCGTHFSIDAVFDNYCPHCGARMEGE